MANTPIVPNAPNVDGHVVSIWTKMSSGGADQEDAASLPDYTPKIIIDIAHPVLSVVQINIVDITHSHYGRPEDEMPRDATLAADTSANAGAGEWRIVDIDTVNVHHLNNEDALVRLTYIAFGVQKA